MHLFVALILTNDDASVLSSNEAPDSNSHAKQSTIKSSTNGKFNLHTFLKEKLLEPNIQKIYGKPKSNGMFISALALCPSFFYHFRKHNIRVSYFNLH